MIVTKVLVLLASVLVLAACSDNAEDGGTGKPRQQTAMEDLTPERLCELLPNDAIEQALDVTVTGVEGAQSGRPPILSKTCRYDVEFTLAEVDTLPPAITTGVVDESEQVGDYERVEGLGDSAGYGTDPLDGGSLNESSCSPPVTNGFSSTSRSPRRLHSTS